MSEAKYDIQLEERAWLAISGAVACREYLSFGRIVAADPQVERFLPVGPFMAKGAIWIQWRFFGRDRHRLFWYRLKGRRAMLRSGLKPGSAKLKQMVQVKPLGSLCCEVIIVRKIVLPNRWKAMTPFVRASQRRAMRMLLGQLLKDARWRATADAGAG